MTRYGFNYILQKYGDNIKPIYGYDGYYVTNNGEIYSILYCKNGECKLKSLTNFDKDGYRKVNLSRNGKVECRRVHRLVAITFIDNPNHYPVINHKNGIKTDNRVENLEWCTVSYNTQHSFDNGFQKPLKGFENKQSKAVVMYDLYTHQEVGRFGSIKEAHRETGIDTKVIAHHCKDKIKPLFLKVYFRFV